MLPSVQGCNAGATGGISTSHQQKLIMQYHSVIESKGARATTLAETLKNADLAFEVREDKVRGETSGLIMPRKKMLYRSDTNEALGIVGEDYCATAPKE